MVTNSCTHWTESRPFCLPDTVLDANDTGGNKRGRNLRRGTAYLPGRRRQADKIKMWYGWREEIRERRSQIWICILNEMVREEPQGGNRPAKAWRTGGLSLGVTEEAAGTKLLNGSFCENSASHGLMSHCHCVLSNPPGTSVCLTQEPPGWEESLWGTE